MYPILRLYLVKQPQAVVHCFVLMSCTKAGGVSVACASFCHRCDSVLLQHQLHDMLMVLSSQEEDDAELKNFAPSLAAKLTLSAPDTPAPEKKARIVMVDDVAFRDSPVALCAVDSLQSVVHWLPSSNTGLINCTSMWA
jgi:hypothetical protein